MFLLGGRLLFGPPMHIFGGSGPPRNPPRNRRARLKHTLAGGKAILISLFSICNGLLNSSYSIESCIFTLLATQIS